VDGGDVVIDLRTVLSPDALLALVGDPVAMTSPAAVTALRAAYAQPPTPADLELWPKLTPPRGLLRRRVPWPTTRAPWVVAAVGRRGGKTSNLAAPVLVYEALCGRHDEEARGRVFYVALAPMHSHARELLHAVRQRLDELAPLGVAYEARDMAGIPEITITSPAGKCERIITILTADNVSVRGRAIACAVIDEAAFIGSDPHLAVTDTDVIKALVPGMSQFSRARLMLVSSPGAPAGFFWKAATKLDARTLVITAPTWVFNPRITREVCVELTRGDADWLAQEYEASKWGFHGENFIPGASALVLGDEHTGKGPREGEFCIGLDVGVLRDATGIVVCSSFEVELSPTSTPLRHIVTEKVIRIAPSKESPVSLEEIAGRVSALSAAFRGAPVVFDVYMAPELRRHLEAHGFREDTNTAYPPGPRSYRQLSVEASAQTPRWALVRAAAQSGRLHIGDDGAELVRELGSLKATQLPSGALRVEGRHDDLCDALALAASQVVRMGCTGGPGGSARCETSIRWDGHELDVTHHWTKNGVPCPPPEWSPTFDAFALQLLSRGIRNDAIERWLAKQPPQIQKAYSLNPAEPVRVERIGDPNTRSERINVRTKF
jgi:hypothetical protein